ncbi:MULTISPECIES: ATP-binding protein [Ramlibacter]|uniref:histidine kinase n=1 Tax=Ramlibacter aquaticus TaxID=2780094 RepID=A0ABR9SD44_9BURK|nr:MULTISPECIES: ATP-binding protein [Ramlibacter]MBE7940269.1 PAS domain S-box protein [Ramlibacter aquaticus]
MNSSSTPGQRSLGTLMAVTFAAMTVVLVTSLLAVTVPLAVNRIDAANGARLEEMATLDRDRLDESLFERYREVQGMAHRLSAGMDWQGARAALDEMQASLPYYAWIGVADTQGKVRAATRGILDGADVTARPWFTQGLHGGHLSDVHEAVLLSSALGNKGAEPLRFFDLSFPVMRDGAVAGVIGAHLYWEWSRQLRTALERSSDSASPPEPVLLAADGKALMGPQAVEGQALAGLASYRMALQGRTGHVVEAWPDGRTYLVGFSRSKPYRDSPGLGWVVLMRQDLDATRAPVRAMERDVALGGLALCLAFGLLAWLAARRIARPVLELAQEAQAIDRGETRVLRAGSGYHEIGILRRAFNTLLQSLQAREQELRQANQELEARVSERTRELQEVLRLSRASERRLQLLIESSPDAFVAIDAAGQVTDWNARAEALFQRTREDALGRPAEDVLQPQEEGALLLDRMRRSALQAPGSAGWAPVEASLRGEGGAVFPAELRCALAETGQGTLLTAFVQDISTRKELERMKDQFIGTVTHELRTPTAAITASLDLVQRMQSGLPPTAARLLDNAVRSARRLARLITDVLWVEKAAAGQMSVQATAQPLLPVLEQAVTEAAAYAQPYGVTLEWTEREACSALVDADRLVQVVLNLMSNAVKFSPRGGTVEISLSCRGYEARIAVADHGPGIPAEFRARMFERFAQDARSGQADKGSGLGLNICRSIVAAHGGRIEFSSEPGVRTEFVVLLPLADAAVARVSAELQPGD